jgi:hypothetical protein
VRRPPAARAAQAEHPPDQADTAGLVTRTARRTLSCRRAGRLTCALPGLSIAQGDLVGLGDVAGLDGRQPLAQALASLPQQLEGVGGEALRGSALGSAQKSR